MKAKKMHIAIILMLILMLIYPNSTYAAGVNEEELEYLRQSGINNEQLQGIEKRHAIVLNEIAEQNLLNKDQVNNMVKTFIKQYQLSKENAHRFTDGSQANILPYNYIERFRNDDERAEILSDPTTWSNISWDEDFGAHWFIESKLGYKGASGYAYLPTAGGSDNDRPYMYFGARTSNWELASDTGIVYYPEFGWWRPFHHIGIWNGRNYSYSDDWDTFAPFNCDRVFMYYTITSQSTYNVFDIMMFNGDTWSTLGSYSIRSDNILTGAMPVNSSYSNLRMTRETTLAQTIEDLNNGAYLHNAVWWNAYIYPAGGVSVLWQPVHTNRAGKANKPEHWARVTVNSFVPWNEDNISIDY